MKYTFIKMSYLLLIPLTISCNKLVDIEVPFQIIITGKVFNNMEDARSAVAGMFYTLGQTGEIFSNGSTTILCGMSADELRPFLEGADNYSQFRTNSLTEANPLLHNNLWIPAYKVIYNANAIITQLEQSSSISQSNRDTLIANARFVRAFSYFYLINYFGDVPLVMSIDYNKTSVLAREKTGNVYQQIISDFVYAQTFLPESYQGAQRVIPTRWAAKALLARVYLYQKNWGKAALEASSVVNQSEYFELSDDLNKVFTVNSREAIWQLESNSKALGGNVTMEGLRFIPYPSVSASLPTYYLTSQLVNRFDSTDQRLSKWTVANSYQGGSYRIPYKYKDGRAQQSAGAAAKEYNTVIRLAELYLIRAEALAQSGNMEGAKEDLNKIRQRAGLAPTTADTRESLLEAIQMEKQKEFFAEWGHRWMDLKRWGLVDVVLSQQKGEVWQSTDQLYPLPVSELKIAPNLVQNPGY